MDSLVKTVYIKNGEMDYIRFGKEDGEKLVILPGLALKSVMGSAQGIIAAYSLPAKDHDVYLFDHIRQEPEGYDIRTMAADTLAAFDVLGLEHVHIMGVSLGGVIAQQIALDAPERVSSLVLCSTAMSTGRADPALFDEWERLAREKDAPALMDAFGKIVYSPEFYEQYRDIIAAAGDGATELDYNNFLTTLAAVRGFDVRDRAKEISCPVLVLAAEGDRLLGVQSAYDMIAALNCGHFIYEGYSHAVYDEAPDFLTHVTGFLSEIE